MGINKVSLGKRIGLLFTSRTSAPALIILYIIMVLIFSILTPNYFTPTNFKLIASNIAVGSIITLGVFFVMISGGFDFSVGSLTALSAVLIVYMFKMNLPIFVIILLILVLGAIIGAINGFIINYVGINPIITTLGVAAMLSGTAKIISTAMKTENIYNETYLKIGSGFIKGVFPFVMIYTIVFYVIASLILKYTQYGRNLYAVGGGYETARLAGINSLRLRFSTYIISGVMTGVAALLLTSQLATGRPEMGSTAALDAVTSSVLGGLVLGGGKGDLLGIFVAMFVIGSVSNGLIMLNIQVYIRYIITGIILIVAIAVNQRRK